MKSSNQTLSESEENGVQRDSRVPINESVSVAAGTAGGTAESHMSMSSSLERLVGAASRSGSSERLIGAAPCLSSAPVAT